MQHQLRNWLSQFAIKLSVKSPLLGLFLFIPTIAVSQWNIGDTWYYTRSEEYMPERYPPLRYDDLRMQVSRDTMVNDIEYQWIDVINPDLCNPLRSSFVARYSEGRVYVYNQESLSEYLLYDFNLTVGDSIVFPVPDLPSLLVVMHI